MTEVSLALSRRPGPGQPSYRCSRLRIARGSAASGGSAAGEGALTPWSPPATFPLRLGHPGSPASCAATLSRWPQIPDTRPLSFKSCLPSGGFPESSKDESYDCGLSTNSRGGQVSTGLLQVPSASSGSCTIRETHHEWWGTRPSGHGPATFGRGPKP